MDGVFHGRLDHGWANAAEPFTAAKRGPTSNGPRHCVPRIISSAADLGFLASAVNGTRFRVNKIINKPGRG